MKKKKVLKKRSFSESRRSFASPKMHSFDLLNILFNAIERTTAAVPEIITAMLKNTAEFSPVPRSLKKLL